MSRCILQRVPKWNFEVFIAFISHFPKQPQLELEPNTSLSSIMAHGHALSDNLCGAILNMARTLDVHSMVEYTGCKHCTVEWILSDYRKKGTVLHKHLAKELWGVKRSLRPSDVKISIRGHGCGWDLLGAGTTFSQSDLALFLVPVQFAEGFRLAAVFPAPIIDCCRVEACIKKDTAIECW